MHVFWMIAAAHFLALLSPGPDFFLVARSSLAYGWRTASGACLGIAAANAVFIAMALGGMALLRAGSAAFTVLQLAGCAYLLYLGSVFIRHAGRSALPALAAQRPAAGSWWRIAAMGFASGILNPKNALFYASLAALLNSPDAVAAGHASIGWKWVYGCWMFSMVLLWDLLVAVLVGNRAVLQRFARALPWLERATGAMLVALAAGMVVAMLW